MITELPPGTDLDAIRDKWLAIGLDARQTTPEDRVKAEAAMRLTYKLADRDDSDLQMFWLQSPYQGAIGSALLSAVPDHRELADAWLDSPLAPEPPKEPHQLVAWLLKKQILAAEAAEQAAA